MKFLIETERLIIRNLSLRQRDDLFEMDSDPEVHRFIENKALTRKSELNGIIKNIQQQYLERRTGRLAVIEKSSGECIGWSGLKFYTEKINGHENFYDLGYRFKKSKWGKGYATESGQAVLEYGFKKYGMKSVYALTHPQNIASQRVLYKLGFQLKGSFDLEGNNTLWFEREGTKREF